MMARTLRRAAVAVALTVAASGLQLVAGHQDHAGATAAPVARSYVLRLPASPAPAPLLVVLHGANQGAAVAEQTYGVGASPATAGWAVAYAQGVGGRWNAGGCCTTAGSGTYDDVTYLRQLVAAAVATGRIDPARVYAFGFSNGGMMVMRAACEAPGLFAAVANISGALLVPCAASVVHVYHLHGGNDTVVPLHGGRGFEGHIFPTAIGEGARFGPGSTLRQHWYSGAHTVPPWAADTVVPWLATYTLAVPATARTATGATVRPGLPRMPR